MHVRVLQRLQRAAAGGRLVDDDGEQRVAERGLDGRLPAGVDLDQVEQRAERAGHPGEVLGAGLRTCRLECHARVPRREPSSADSSSAASWRAAAAASAATSAAMRRASADSSCGDERRLDLLRLLARVAQPVGLGLESLGPLAQDREPRLERAAPRTRHEHVRSASTGAHHAPRPRHVRLRWPSGLRRCVLPASKREPALLGELGLLRGERGRLGLERGELARRPCRGPRAGAPHRLRGWRRRRRPSAGRDRARASGGARR